MKPVFKTILLTALLASLTGLSMAQPGPGPGPGGSGPGAGGPGPNPEMRARMQERVKERAADIKVKLKLTPDQEGLWTSYVDAMKPSPDVKWPSRAEMDKLSTPERLDKLHEMRKQRDDQMDKREAATRAFYSKLTPEQKKIFDANTGPQYHNRGAWGPRAR
jgi:hypothetical protein